MYSEGYKISPKLRVPGAIAQDILLVWILVLAIKSGIQSDDCLILTVIGYMFLCLMVGFAFTGPLRKKYFTEEFMSQFSKEHKEAFGDSKKLPVGEGYPDTGSGRYCLKLPYAQWFKFNVAQRLHLNFLETLVYYVMGFVAVSISFPTLGLVFAILFLILRVGYTITYYIHPNKREFFAKAQFYGALPLLIVGIISILIN